MDYQYIGLPQYLMVQISQPTRNYIFIVLCRDYCYNCNFVEGRLIVNMFRMGEIEFENFKSLNISYCNVLVGHIVPFALSNIVLRAMIYIQDDIHYPLPSIQLFIKIPKGNPNRQSLEIRRFKKEVAFYSEIRNLFTVDILPRYYIADMRYMSEQPIIVLEDLVVRGFTRMHYKLHTIDLYLCFEGLAHFHGNFLHIRNEHPEVFNQFLETLETCLPQDRDQERIRQEQAASIFFDRLFTVNLDSEFRQKIKSKLDKVKHLHTSTVTTLIHGSCIRSNIFLQNSRDTIKLTDFQQLKLGHPVIDFGRLLFTNMPDDKNMLKLKNLFEGTLCVYMRTLEQYYPLIMHEQWKQEIINNLLYSFVNLEETEASQIVNKGSIMYALDELGCFE